MNGLSRGPERGRGHELPYRPSRGAPARTRARSQRASVGSQRANASDGSRASSAWRSSSSSATFQPSRARGRMVGAQVAAEERGLLLAAGRLSGDAAAAAALPARGAEAPHPQVECEDEADTDDEEREADADQEGEDRLDEVHGAHPPLGHREEGCEDVALGESHLILEAQQQPA